MRFRPTLLVVLLGCSSESPRSEPLLGAGAVDAGDRSDVGTPADGGVASDAEPEEIDTRPRFYVGPSGNDANPGTEAAPWRTFAKAWATIRPGQVIVLLDGTYNQDLSPPPGTSGAAGALITVRAEHDGAAIVDGEGARSTLVVRGCAFLTFEGLRLGNGMYGSLSVGSSTGKAGGSPSHDNAFRRLGVFGWKALTGNNVTVGIGGGSHHNVIEDSWIYGRGRYSLMIYGGNGGGDVLDAPENVVRRVVVRHDPYPPAAGDPQAGLAIYSANKNVVENVIVLDGIEQSDSDNSALYLTGHAPDTVNENKILGSIALGNTGGGLVMDADLSRSNRFENNVIWGSTGGGLTLTKDAQSNVYDKMTVDNARAGDPNLFYQAGAGTVLHDSLLMNAGYAVKNTGTVVATYDYFFGNRNGDCEGCTLNATNDTTHRNPGMKYLLRQEPGSPTKGTGEGGGDRGATILQRYKGGALTATPLWPWPNEARIRSEMCNAQSLTDYGRTGTQASAFCASGKGLSRYVWELAGNPCPAGLCP